jgi:hypothetical protein
VSLNVGLHPSASSRHQTRQRSQCLPPGPAPERDGGSAPGGAAYSGAQPIRGRSLFGGALHHILTVTNHLRYPADRCCTPHDRTEERHLKRRSAGGRRFSLRARFTGLQAIFLSPFPSPLFHASGSTIQATPPRHQESGIRNPTSGIRHQESDMILSARHTTETKRRHRSEISPPW